jgi:hypothetical protein
VSGDVLLRTNRTSHAGTSSSTAAAVPRAPTAGTFQGSYTPVACGPKNEFEVPAATRSIAVTASTVVPNDIILNLYDPAGAKVATSDLPLGPNPESIQYSPGGVVPEGTWAAEVCPFDENQTRR